ncbi:DUF4030 domain-containing protein [Neobacillus vireti]|uniref:DUF4030 domain-containing protein n=1 Tax=Neobacillus vireti TaxID=220686 RepID=UPI002FFF1BA3
MEKNLKAAKEYYQQHYYHEDISNRIKQGVIQSIHRKKRVSMGKRIFYFSSAVIAAFALFIGLAFYSPAVASVAAKVPFLKMIFEFKPVADIVSEALTKKGYKHEGMGVQYSPTKIFTVTIKGSEAYVDKVRPDVTRIVKEILLAREMDAYKIKVERAIERHDQQPTAKEKALMEKQEQIFGIVRNVLISYGYEHESIGMNAANTIELNLPKTETRIDEIKQQIQIKLTEQKLGFHTINVRKYDPEKREREGRWSPIISTIADGIFGSKKFKVTGVGYTNRSAEYMMISIRTSVSSKDSDYKRVVTNIENTILEFLTSKETKAIIKDDAYKITIISKDKKETVITSD